MKDKISYILLVLLALGPFNADCLSFLKNKLTEGDPLSLTSDPESDSRKEVSDNFLSFELNNPLKSLEKESDSLLSFEFNNPLKSRDDCDYPKQTGYCFASKKRFYFNGETCEAFTYGGCGGNRNNFKTKEECMKKCSHKLDIGSGVAEDEDEMFLISFP